jgi:hypothetical protein
MMHLSPLAPFHSNEEVEVTIGEWLYVQKSDFCHDRIFKLLARWVMHHIAEGSI